MSNDKILSKRKRYFLILIFLCILFVSNSIFASVEVFSKYDTTLKVRSNNIQISKDMVLRNVYNVGIMPGDIEFKIAKGLDGSIKDLKVMNVSAFDSFDKKIPIEILELNNYSVIRLSVFYPLLPGHEYEIKLNYVISYKSGGILFKSLNIPIRESTIPIKNGEFKVILPKNYHFTYLGDKNINASILGNTVTWKIKENIPNSIDFEYSRVPLRLFNLKGSYIFWLIVDLLLFLFLLVEVRKEFDKIEKDKMNDKIQTTISKNRLNHKIKSQNKSRNIKNDANSTHTNIKNKNGHLYMGGDSEEESNIEFENFENN